MRHRVSATVCTYCLRRDCYCKKGRKWENPLQRVRPASLVALSVAQEWKTERYLNLRQYSALQLTIREGRGQARASRSRYSTDCYSVNDTVLPLQRRHEKKVRIKHKMIRFEEISDGPTCAKHAITTSQKDSHVIEFITPFYFPTERNK